jgi:hypothetical protein
VKDVYGGEADLACWRCEVSRNPLFRLAPKNLIFDLLEWPQAAQHSAGTGRLKTQPYSHRLLSPFKMYQEADYATIVGTAGPSRRLTLSFCC